MTKNTQNKKTQNTESQSRAALLEIAQNKLVSFNECTQKQHDSWTELFLAMYKVARADDSKLNKNQDSCDIYTKNALRDTFGATWFDDKKNKTRKSEYLKILRFLFPNTESTVQNILKSSQKNVLDMARGNKKHATRSNTSKWGSIIKTLEKISLAGVDDDTLISAYDALTEQLYNIEGRLYNQKLLEADQLVIRKIDNKTRRLVV